MREQIKYSLGLIGLGASLVLYAQTNFATKDQVMEIKSETASKEAVNNLKENVNEIKEDQKEIKKLVLSIYQEIKK